VWCKDYIPTSNRHFSEAAEGDLLSLFIYNSKWFLSQQAQEHWLAAWNNIIHIQVYDVDCFYGLLHKSLVKECSNTASQCNR
jgi:hypothetical protein